MCFTVSEKYTSLMVVHPLKASSTKVSLPFPMT